MRYCIRVLLNLAYIQESFTIPNLYPQNLFKLLVTLKRSDHGKVQCIFIQQSPGYFLYIL